MVDTRNRGGSTLRKGFTVYTNDPVKPQIKLIIEGTVKGYVSITPQAVRLFGAPGSSVQQKVQISPLEGHPFSIKNVKAQKDKYIRYDVKPMDQDSGKKGYTLLIENTKGDSGSYRDTILIETDSKKKPLLRIPVFGRIGGQPQPGGQMRK